MIKNRFIVKQDGHIDFLTNQIAFVQGPAKVSVFSRRNFGFNVTPI